MLEIGEYRKLIAEPMDFNEFLLGIPKGPDLEIERSKDPGREIHV